MTHNNEYNTEPFRCINPMNSFVHFCSPPSLCHVPVQVSIRKNKQMRRDKRNFTYTFKGVRLIAEALRLFLNSITEKDILLLHLSC